MCDMTSDGVPVMCPEPTPLLCSGASMRKCGPAFHSVTACSQISTLSLGVKRGQPVLWTAFPLQNVHKPACPSCLLPTMRVCSGISLNLRVLLTAKVVVSKKPPTLVSHAGSIRLGCEEMRCLQMVLGTRDFPYRPSQRVRQWRSKPKT